MNAEVQRLFEYLQKYHMKELEEIMADVARQTYKPATITWSCGFGSITMTIKKALEFTPNINLKEDNI